MEPERSKEQYRECMRNHAASLGTYATDGCGEYTPDPSSPGGLRCAACGCHRNFHRKYVAFGLGGGGSGGSAGLPSPASSEDRGGGGGSEGKRRTRTKFSEEQKEQMLQFAERIGWRIQRRDGGGGGSGGGAARGDDEVARFCREIGVSRQVFKVWMHNHKNSSVSSSSTTITTPTGAAINKGSPSSLIH